MKEEQIKQFLHKKVRISLNNGFSYVGIINEVSDGSIGLNDRFVGLIAIDCEMVSLIVPLNGGVSQ